MVKITEVEKTISPAGGGVWVQVHDYAPENIIEMEKRGRLIALLAVRGKKEEETMKLVELGREVLAFFHEQYYGNLEGGVLVRLKETLGKTEEEFGGQVEAVVLCEVEDVLYVGTVGGARVYAYLEGQGEFVGSEIKNEVRGFSFLKKIETRLILGTGGFWEKIGEGSIRALLESEKSNREMAEELGVVIGSDETGLGMGGVMARLDDVKVVEFTEIESVPQRQEKPWMNVNFWEQIRDTARNTTKRLGFMAKINWGVVFLIMLVILVVGGGVIRNYQTNKGKEVSGKLLELEQKLKEADLLSGTNAERSQEIVAEVKPELENMKNIKNNKVAELLNLAISVEETASGLVRISFGEIFDVALLREGFEISRLVNADKNILGLDSKNSRLLLYETEKEKGEVVLGSEEMSGTRSVTYYSGQVYMLGSYGIKECNAVDWKCGKKIESSEIPAGYTDLAVWAGNFYLLDGQEGRIWKYIKQGSVYTKKNSWMDADSQLLGGENLVIDGRIWAGYLNGGIGKYNQGVKENFDISGLSLGLGKNIWVQTSDEETKLYILDRENKRIVVVEKNGNFVKQFVAEEIGQASSFLVVEEKAKIYLSLGSKIFVAEIF